MKCEVVQHHLVLAIYGELPDEITGPVERHLASCEECSRELSSLQALDQYLAIHPLVEPSPNLLAQSRLQLDEALDLLPPHGFLTRLQVNLNNWFGHLQNAPALMTLLVGAGFLAGNFTFRYQVAHAPKPPAVVNASNSMQGSVGNVTGIVTTPNPEIVQVKYNRVIPETMEGSLDSAEIRQLLLAGMTSGTTMDVRESSVNLLSHECKAGHSCTAETNGKGIRDALLVSLRYDHNAGVRLKALEGLQPYIRQDQRVRDVVLESVLGDRSSEVRSRAIGLLTPVESDASVRQVLRTASTQDENAYIRTASFQALQGSAEIE